VKRGRIRPVSRKRLDQRPAREALVERVKTRDVACQGQPRFGMVHDCRGPLVVHELIPRSLWRDGYLVDANCVLVCSWLNGWVEDNTADALALGLARPSWARKEYT
jgi:hypothetical protein